MAQSLFVRTLRKDFAIVSAVAIIAFVVGVLLVNILTGTGAEAGQSMTDAQEQEIAAVDVPQPAQPTVYIADGAGFDGIRVIVADGSEDAARRAYLESLAGAR